MAQGRMRTESMEIKEELRILQAENDMLERELKTKDYLVQHLSDKVDTVRDELQSTEKNYEDKIKDLQLRLTQKEGEMQRRRRTPRESDPKST